MVMRKLTVTCVEAPPVGTDDSAGEPTVSTPPAVRRQPSPLVSVPASATQNVVVAPETMRTSELPPLYVPVVKVMPFVGSESVTDTTVAFVLPELVRRIEYSTIAPGIAFGFVALLNGSLISACVFATDSAAVATTYASLSNS